MVAQSEFHVDDADFELVRDVVYKHCGITLSDDKKAMVRARLAKQIREGGYSSAREYLDHALAEGGGKRFSEFIDAISTNLTSFFRESDHFDYLADVVLPEMLERKHQSGNARILTWSAACSTGEEAYTLAMTIQRTIDRLRMGSMRWDVRILATDISTRVLAAAHAGIYDAERLKTVPTECKTQFFTPRLSEHGKPQFEVVPQLREMVRCRHLNLIEPWPFSGPFDFLFCRNVMIYFDKATQQGLVDRFWKCLSPGGLLFTGHSESLMGINHKFLSLKPSIYEKPRAAVS